MKLFKSLESPTARTRNLGGARRFQVVCEALKGVVEGSQDIKGGWKVCSTAHASVYRFDSNVSAGCCVFVDVCVCVCVVC